MRRRSTDGLREVLPGLLLERGWTQKRLSRASGVDQAYLCRVLRSDRRVPPELASRIAEALGLPADFFPECREREVIEAVRKNPVLRDRIYARLVRRSVSG